MNTISRLGWYVLLFFTLLLFVFNLSWQLPLLNLAIIGLAGFIYKYGQPVMFKEYEARRQRKLADAKIVKDAAEKALHSGNLFKK